MHVCVYVCVCLCVREHAWRSEVNIRHLPLCLSTLLFYYYYYFRQCLSLNPELTDVLGWLAGPTAFQIPLPWSPSAEITHIGDLAWLCTHKGPVGLNRGRRICRTSTLPTEPFPQNPILISEVLLL